MSDNVSTNSGPLYPFYPHITVQLVGTDGNAFAILGKCRSAAKRAGLSPDRVEEFTTEATSGDYNHLLATCMKWFEIV